MLEHTYNNSDALFATCLKKHIYPLLQSIDRTDVPILHSIIGIVTNAEIIRTIMTTLPHLGAWCHVRDSKGRLPLHVAAQVGWKWDERICILVEKNIHATGEVDPITGLFPFLLAAAGSLSFIEGDEKDEKETVVKKKEDKEKEKYEETGINGNDVEVEVEVAVEDENNDQSYRTCDLNSIYRLARCNPNSIGFQNRNMT